MSPSDWQLIADGFIPALAILIPTVIAISLAVLERRAARRDRASQRADRLMEEIIDDLAFFVSVNPVGEDIRARLRSLRSRVVVMQTLPGAHGVVGWWLAGEARRGVEEVLVGMTRLESVPKTPENVAAAMASTHRWAHECVMRLAGWMRGDVNTSELAVLASELDRKHPQPTDLLT